MVQVPSLTAHFAPDTVRQLEQAAEKRYEDGECLRQQKRLLAAIYLYGYSVEMCLAAAYFRSAGFRSDQAVDDDVRRRRMAQARQQLHLDGKPLMSSDAYPLVGWARLLEWQRKSCQSLTPDEQNRLHEAVQNAEQVYIHWRPELRYKLTSVSTNQLNEVRRCVNWFLK